MKIVTNWDTADSVANVFTYFFGGGVNDSLTKYGPEGDDEVELPDCNKNKQDWVDMQGD